MPQIGVEQRRWLVFGNNIEGGTLVFEDNKG